MCVLYGALTYPESRSNTARPSAFPFLVPCWAPVFILPSRIPLAIFTISSALFSIMGNIFFDSFISFFFYCYFFTCKSSRYWAEVITEELGAAAADGPELLRMVWNWVLDELRPWMTRSSVTVVEYSLHWVVLTVAVVDRTISPGATVVFDSAHWVACWTCRTGLRGGWGVGPSAKSAGGNPGSTPDPSPSSSPWLPRKWWFRNGSDPPAAAVVVVVVPNAAGAANPFKVDAPPGGNICAKFKTLGGIES